MSVVEKLQKQAEIDSHVDEVKKIAADTKEKAKLLQTVVYDNSNPHPAKVAVMFALVLALIWLIYIMFVKPNMSGVWLDTKGNKWIIEQNMCQVKVKMILDGKTVKGTAKITGNIFKFKGIIGVWNYNDVVVFINGGGGMERLRD